MEIMTIFTTEDQGLYAFRLDNEIFNEMDRLFELWQDIEYLEEFFDTNEKDLKSGFYGDITVEDAIIRTREDAKELQKQLLSIKEGIEPDKFLNKYFKPLDNSSYRSKDLEKSKAYGTVEKTWIRLYAIKMSDNYFVITGGTIKLTQRMAERNHTQEELDKLDKCKDYLRKEGIFDEDGLNEIVK